MANNFMPTVECKKPKFDGNNANSRMSKNTNPIGIERGRLQNKSNDGETSNGEKDQFVCYKCNNLGHIARNCRAPESQNGSNQRRNALVCQLCNNFKQTLRYSRMDRRNFNRNPKKRRNNNRNDRRNDNGSNNSQKEAIKRTF